jgi:hypothetical protein
MIQQGNRMTTKELEELFTKVKTLDHSDPEWAKANEALEEWADELFMRDVIRPDRN